MTQRGAATSEDLYTLPKHWRRSSCSYSACNQFASSPPRVFNGDGSIYYGELTLNQFRADAIRTSSIVSWLVNDVCP